VKKSGDAETFSAVAPNVQRVEVLFVGFDSAVFAHAHVDIVLLVSCAACDGSFCQVFGCKVKNMSGVLSPRFGDRSVPPRFAEREPKLLVSALSPAVAKGEEVAAAIDAAKA
jgi:hypothetical protein